MSKRSITAIIMVRLDSNRVPRKALTKVGPLTLLQVVIRRVKQVTGISKVIIATTQREVDNDIENVAREENVSIYRHAGDVNDVASRLLSCALKHEADYFFRINADSPFFDVPLANKAIRLLSEEDYDLVTNIPRRTFPYGIAVELINTARYQKLYGDLAECDKEHVTIAIYKRIQEEGSLIGPVIELFDSSFRVRTITTGEQLQYSAEFVIDTPEQMDAYINMHKQFGDELFGLQYLDLVQQK